MSGHSEVSVCALMAVASGSMLVLQQQVFVPALSSGAGKSLSLRSSTSALPTIVGGVQDSLTYPGGHQGSRHSATFLGVLGGCTVGLVTARARSLRKSSRHAFDAAAQEGVTEPFGYFDPLGFAKGKDAAEFRKLRVAEIKHGRVAMMASIGLVMPHFFKAPGFEKVPAGIGAVFTDMGGAGFVALFLGAGLHELVLWKDDATKDAGDFGDPFNFAKSISVERNYELNNGRMAMFAVIGELVAQLVSGKDAVEQFGLKG